MSMFAGATGRGVRVAVIDSGVNSRHPHIQTPVAGGIAIGPDPAANGSLSYIDVMGHGTAVMAAIQEKAPQAECFAVKVFHDSLRTSIRQLLAAMEWAIAERMDVINLSLGTRNAEHAPRFLPLIERASEIGCVLVSAIEAEGAVCFPGSLPEVIGVGLDAACPRDIYRVDGEVFRASPYPRSLPGVPVERNLSGISFAVANMTGIVACARESLGVPVTRDLLLREAAAAGSSARI